MDISKVNWRKPTFTTITAEELASYIKAVARSGGGGTGCGGRTR